MMKSHNLVEMLAQTVKQYPDKTALRWKQDGKYHSMTYQKLWNTIRDFAFGLERLGIRAGTKVAILSENHPCWVISDFALLSLGAVSVPIYPALQVQQIFFMLQHTDTEAVIVQQPDLLTQITKVPKCTRHFILMNGKAKGDVKALQFETVIQLGQTAVIEDTDWAYPSIQSSDPATIVHSSVGDENPKAILLSHGNILSNIEMWNHFVPYTSLDTFLSILPLSDMFERVTGHFAPICAGATVAYAESVEKAFINMREVHPTILIGTPGLFQTIYRGITEDLSQSPIKHRFFDWAMKIAARHQQIASQGFNWAIPKKLRLQYAFLQDFVFANIYDRLGGQLRFMVSGGSMPDAEVRQFFSAIGLPVLEAYGMAECTAVIASNRLAHIKPGTEGKPLPGTEIRFLPDGELLVKSPSVMTGYYKDPEESAKTIVNGWLHTGVTAQADKDNYIRIIDRKST
ncbi:AMP-dependent synthetase/ligase [Paenactinomyces guangxiensis]|uniref:AMP-binding protein n=1 Tax=Paenactinomyces guangxiensis TaxID=1490290 RepID=A0A7W2A898_9BACL|nr:AMP-binding protein [Paenactinomyces guangxiensis]MBA4495391.1 AMP-binding protein [Paenactinomyces guangxiensis]MBH8592488.1 AMP-binding protein [Paenactinomyces guangxiensis]